MFDKILLATLLLLLPITIVLTNFYAKKSEQPSVSQENLTKVNQMLDQLQQSIKQKPQAVELAQINIAAV